MDKKTFHKIFFQAVSYGLKRRLKIEQAEDFAQRFILARYVVRTDQKINQAFIDYLRHEYGDARGSASKRIARKSFLPIKDDVCGFYELPEDVLLWQLLMEKTLHSPAEAKIIQMKFEGYTLQEIAHTVKLSTPRIFQILRLIAKRLDLS